VAEKPKSDRLTCWCGHDQSNRVFQAARFGLVLCPNCGCYKIDPPAITHPGESVEFYNQHYSAEEAKRQQDAGQHTIGRSSRFWRIVKRENSLDQPRDRVLDWGCGDGLLCAELRAAGWQHVFGVDIARRRVAFARAHYPDIHFYDVPLEETDIPQESIDLIITDSVIEHLPDPVEHMAQLRQYLKPDGKLVVSTPNMNSGNFRLLGRFWRGLLAPNVHIFLFTPESIERCLQLAGFQVLRVGSYHVGTRNHFRRMLSSRHAKEFLMYAGYIAGDIYAHVLSSGPMLYAVATPAAPQEPA
jgi:2-polyprenyl-3-methyl-5-hydroxy-6-metoxy-1,4-benzoquinol methylase